MCPFVNPLDLTQTCAFGSGRESDTRRHCLEAHLRHEEYASTLDSEAITPLRDAGGVYRDVRCPFKGCGQVFGARGFGSYVSHAGFSRGQDIGDGPCKGKKAARRAVVAANAVKGLKDLTRSNLVFAQKGGWNAADWQGCLVQEAHDRFEGDVPLPVILDAVEEDYEVLSNYHPATHRWVRLPDDVASPGKPKLVWADVIQKVRKSNDKPVQGTTTIITGNIDPITWWTGTMKVDIYHEGTEQLLRFVQDCNLQQPKKRRRTALHGAD